MVQITLLRQEPSSVTAETCWKVRGMQHLQLMLTAGVLDDCRFKMRELQRVSTTMHFIFFLIPGLDYCPVPHFCQRITTDINIL